MSIILFLLTIFLISSCDVLDEKSPDAPSGLRAYFSMKGDQAFVRINWDEVENDNILEYHIFRSSNGGDSFDLLDKVNSSFYFDEEITWLGEYHYKVSSKDVMNNVSKDSSNSVSVYCYGASGKWVFIDYDPLYNFDSLCVDPINFSINQDFKVESADSFSIDFDTIKTMAFSMCFLDTNTWEASGWMTKSKKYRDSTVFIYEEINMDTIVYDDTTFFVVFDTIISMETIIDTYTISESPELYEINFSNPVSGSISFTSGNESSIILEHSSLNCDGENLFQ